MIIDWQNMDDNITEHRDMVTMIVFMIYSVLYVRTILYVLCENKSRKKYLSISTVIWCIMGHSRNTDKLEWETFFPLYLNLSLFPSGFSPPLQSIMFSREGVPVDVGAYGGLPGGRHGWNLPANTALTNPLTSYLTIWLTINLEPCNVWEAAVSICDQRRVPTPQPSITVR